MAEITAKPRRSTGGADLPGLARGGSLNLIGALISAATSFLVIVVITRGLRQNAAGEFFAVTSVFLLTLSVGKLGSATGLVYFISRYRALGMRRGVRRSMDIAVQPVIVTALLAAVLMFVFAPQLAHLIVHGSPKAAVHFLRQLAFFIPFAAASEAFQAGTRGFGRMRTTVAVERVGRPLLQLVLLGLAIGLGTGLVAVAWALPYAPAALVSAWALRRVWQREAALPGGEAESPPGMAKAYWRFTAPRAMTGLVQVALQRLDIILVAALRSPAEAAIYATATRFLVVGSLGNQAIAMAVQPQVSALLARNDRTGAGAVYRMTTAWLILICWPIYLLTALFSETILSIFGPGYAAGEIVMALLAGSMLVATACGLVDLMLAMGGRTTWNLANIFVALVVNVGLDLLLIPQYGIRGAAIGWAAAILASNIVPLIQINWLLRLHPFGRETLGAAALAVACYGAIPLVGRIAVGDRPDALLGTAVLGTAIYAPVLWRLRHALHLGDLPGLRRRGRHRAAPAATGHDRAV